MYDEPVSLRRSLERFLHAYGAPPVDVVSRLTGAWGQVVGPALDGPTRPLELVDGVLVVLCDDPAWASQIGWMDRQIRDRLVALFPQVTVDRVVTRTARRP